MFYLTKKTQNNLINSFNRENKLYFTKKIFYLNLLQKFNIFLIFVKSYMLQKTTKY